MPNIKLTIEYNGTRFFGWQIQNPAQPSIQGEMEKALSKIFHAPIRVTASGRTDRGVHAAGQVANFHTSSVMSCRQIVNALNAHLSKDISVRTAEIVDDGFHAQYRAKSKIYRYTVLNRQSPGPLSENISHLYRHPLDIRAMQNEAKTLCGRKNFKSFQAVDPAKRERENNTIRTVKKFKISRSGDFIYFDVEADGFLYKMVRNMVGALLEVGSGRLPKGSIDKILRQKNRCCAPKTAPAKGLCLLEVKY